jgi:hypothetical protein
MSIATEMTMPILPIMPAVLAVAAVGALIAYTGYRRSTRRKKHDMRTELRDEQASLRAAVEALPAQIDLAKRSRKSAADAEGNTATEGLHEWLGQLDLDLSEAELLRSQLSAADADKSLSDMDVEVKLVEVLAMSLRVSMLAEKYRASISVHETDRDSRTEDAEAQIQEAPQHSLGKSGSSVVESAV